MSVSPQAHDANTGVVTAPSVTLATFNYEHGGFSRHTGGYSLEPAADHVAACVPDLDLLLFQEGNHYQRDGGRAAFRFAELLHERLGGSWGTHLAVNTVNPHHNLVYYRTGRFRVIEAWSRRDDPDFRAANEGTVWLRVDGIARPLIVGSVHWRSVSGPMRAEQARALCTLIPHLAIIGGDMNCLWPGAMERRPPWHELPPHLAGSKTLIDPGTGALSADLQAGSIALRHGWVDAGALAEDYSETTNLARDPAPCRIDRIMVSPGLGATLDTPTYRVHQDPRPADPISDHRVVSVRLHLAEYGRPFHAPWWDESSFGGWTYAGAEYPRALGGWVRRSR